MCGGNIQVLTSQVITNKFLSLVEGGVGLCNLPIF